MSAAFDAMPLRGRYRVIYADPPWSFETWSHRGQGKGASQHYDVMDLDAIKRLPVNELAAPAAALFLWVVQPMFPEALDLIRAWGFTYKTVGYVWVKTKPKEAAPFLFWDDAWADGLTKIGLGYHTRSGCEQCWIATRGQGYERLSKGEPQVVHAPVREHSRKPDEIAESIVRLADGPRAELFARTRRLCFDVWGNQIDKFDGVHRTGDVAPANPLSAPRMDRRSDPEDGRVNRRESAMPESVAKTPDPQLRRPGVGLTAGETALSADDLLEIPAWLRRDPVTNALKPMEHGR